jgi:cation diffusion facilitator family transporter
VDTDPHQVPDPHQLSGPRGGDEGRRRGERAHRIGLGLNTALALMKLGAGTAAGSPALLADGWHSLSDMLTGAVAWLGWRLGGRPPDDDHHFGHGNHETLAGMLVGLVLCAGGIAIAVAGLRGGPVETDLAHGRIALAAAAVSIVANLVLVRVTLGAARELGSASLMALARDNMGDVLSSLLVVPGVLGSLWGAGWLEPAMTAVIGCLVAWMGLKSIREGLDVLTARVPESGLRDEVGATAAAVEGVTGVQRVRLHPVGSALHADMELSVDGSLTVEQGHEIAHRVARAVTGAHPSVVEVQVHVNPAPGPGTHA